MTERFDAIVVGGGAMGTAAARSLAQRERNTLLLERFSVGHAQGSSGGPTRIFRLVYDMADYIEMARLAQGLWRELEDVSGEELLRVTGGLEIDRGSAVEEALTAAGVPFEVLSADDVCERWPALHLPAGVRAVFQAEGGVDTTVTQLSIEGDEVRVTTTSDESFTAPVAVVSAGAWAPSLLGSVELDLAMVPTQEQVTYFDLDRPEPLPSIIDWVLSPPRRRTSCPIRGSRAGSRWDCTTPARRSTPRPRASRSMRSGFDA